MQIYIQRELSECIVFLFFKFDHNFSLFFFLILITSLENVYQIGYQQLENELNIMSKKIKELTR